LLTRDVTVGENKATIATLKCGSVPNGLVQKTGQTHVKTLRASSSHDKIRESNMVTVVVAVEGLTGPAGGEHDLETNTVLAVGIKVGLLGHVVAVKSSLRILGIVQAVETKGTLGEGVLASLLHGGPSRLLGVWLTGVSSSVGTSFSVARHHSETFGESGDVFAVEQVVTAPG
jgi:hypothetical protein